jgi:hypothetical protein
MNNERKLSALLHELQHAKSPLAQARVLARAWRTIRELGPTDRKLLARHAGFEGAEDILEGLNRRKGGLAPAMLLRVLANARSTDGATVSDLLASFRDPDRRQEAISRSVDLAGDLLAEPDEEEEAAAAPPEDVSEALDELQAVEESIAETPEEALAALNALEPDPDVEPEPTSEPVFETDAELAEEPETDPEPEPPSQSDPPPAPPVVDWSRWQMASDWPRPAPAPRPEIAPIPADAGPRRFEAKAVMGAMGAASSVLSQLRVLRRELSGFKGSSVPTLRELIESFPDGWVRRRALCALLEEGIPSETSDALELVSTLGRELDRRWCLGVLAHRGLLSGVTLKRALDMVDSPFGKKRLRTLAS